VTAVQWSAAETGSATNATGSLTNIYLGCIARQM